jgi:hypothetical protein
MESRTVTTLEFHLPGYPLIGQFAMIGGAPAIQAAMRSLTSRSLRDDNQKGNV